MELLTCWRSGITLAQGDHAGINNYDSNAECTPNKFSSRRPNNYLRLIYDTASEITAIFSDRIQSQSFSHLIFMRDKRYSTYFDYESNTGL